MFPLIKERKGQIEDEKKRDRGRQRRRLSGTGREKKKLQAVSISISIASRGTLSFITTYSPPETICMQIKSYIWFELFVALPARFST